MKKELISTLIQMGVLIALVLTLSISSVSLLETWRMTFSQAPNMDVTGMEVKSLLVVWFLYFLSILGPIFLIALFGGLGGFVLGLRKIKPRLAPIKKSILAILETTIILSIFFIYIYLNFDHVLYVTNFTVDQIYSFIWKMVLEIISIILILKIVIISITILSGKYQSKSESQ
ncbi:MAG: hypothetical protein ACQ9MH_10225 [Nitrospinales bacterium]